MMGIDLSPKMVDKAAKRGCYNVLVVGNEELVILLSATADPPPALNAPRYSEVKVKVVSVNVNGSVGINGNCRCRVVGGGEESKEEKDNKDGGVRGGGGAKRRRQQQRLYFDTVFDCDVLVYISDLRSLFRSVWDSLILPSPTMAE